nr:permease [Candidatus Desulfatifera sulfidica]
MDPLQNFPPCACQTGEQKHKQPEQDKISIRQLLTGLLMLIAWFLIYKQLLPFSH